MCARGIRALGVVIKKEAAAPRGGGGWKKQLRGEFTPPPVVCP